MAGSRRAGYRPARGLPRLAAGPDSWWRVGRAVSYLGIEGGYTYWGLAAVLALTFGAIGLILGWCHRPAALALTVTMAVAAIWKFFPFGGWDAAAYALAMGTASLALLLTGPGKIALDR
jgi:putative oxidoreductase